MNVFFSFNSSDAYYKQQANELANCLDKLGLEYTIKELDIPDGLEWPDVCRMKIKMLLDFFEENRDKKIFWIDADCRLSNFPDFVKNFSADVIGFQRGFGNPLKIGYQSKSRFWEPCFIGFNATEPAYRFLKRASELEKEFPGRATDDYFFEESWRELCGQISYQLIPSGYAEIQGRIQKEGALKPFFHFGSSGNVKKFVHKVNQHEVTWMNQTPKYVQNALKLKLKIKTVLKGGRKNVVSAGRKHTPRVLKEVIHRSLTGEKYLALTLYKKKMIAAARAGDGVAIERVVKEVGGFESLSSPEVMALRQAYALLSYSKKKGSSTESLASEKLSLVWWYQPAPGNFGDWLSPYIFSKLSKKSLNLVRPEEANKIGFEHYFGVGSIGKFIGPKSIVLGTGISSSEAHLDPRATYVMVRGPITRARVVAAGGDCPEVYGDPAVALPKIYKSKIRSKSENKFLLVRHFCHLEADVVLGEHIDELSILVSHPSEIESFIDELHRYEGVITSAMHCHIVCQAYGIPSVLVTFSGAESAVHGDGIKYLDYQRGVGLKDFKPLVVNMNLAELDILNVLGSEYIDSSVIEKIYHVMANELQSEIVCES